VIEIVNITVAAFACCRFFRVESVPSVPETEMATAAQPGEFNLVGALCDGIFSGS
jgi:hypothetical protein